MAELQPVTQLPLTAEQFADDPSELRRTLEDRGALTFEPYASGLFPASALTAEMREATGMGMAWRRDNGHIINALFETGRHDLAADGGRGLMATLNNDRYILDGVASGLLNPNAVGNRLPSRVTGHTLQKDTEHRVQNDSVGYPLWTLGRLITHDVIRPTEYDLETMARTVQYLGRIAYWQDKDAGHWEEDHRVHASSVGAVVAGLAQTQQALQHMGYRHGLPFNELMQRGKNTLNTMHTLGVTDAPSIAALALRQYRMQPSSTQDAQDSVQQFSPDFRAHDAAMLFLIEPLQVLSEAQAAKVVTDVETHLVRQHGVIRYSGDTYWGPRFKDLMRIDERTSQAPGRLESRNQKAAGVAYSQTEAQWTLFDSPLSTYHGRQYLQTGGDVDHRKQLLFLNRTLAQLVPQGNTLQLPEAYYLERTPKPGEAAANQWVPNDHSPLLWAQANLLLALKTFEQTGV